MSGSYAEGTKVDPGKSREEIERTLERYGASGFGYLQEGRDVAVLFRAHGKTVRFIVRMPDPEDDEFTRTPKERRKRSPDAARKEYHKETRRLWRVLALGIKAKLEMVESGVVTFEEEFLPHFVMPDGKTVAQHAIPALERAAMTGEMPRSLLALPEHDDEAIDAEVVEA